MADKYLIHGATYCGDGTTSAEAASNGAAGAWNNINVLEGTAPAYGSLAAGDTVYIRSKTSAGADITRTLGAAVTLGSATATDAVWITWVLDGGTIWAGINGTLTYEAPSSYSVNLTNYNRYVSEVEDSLVIRDTSTTANKVILHLKNYTVAENLFVDISPNTSGYSSYITSSTTGDHVLKNLHFKLAAFEAERIAQGAQNVLTLINPRIELTVASTAGGLIGVGDYGSRIFIQGGRVYGAGATTGVALFSVSTPNGSGLVHMEGLVVPRTMLLMKTHRTYGTWRIEGMGFDAGEGGYVIEPWGYADSRADGYYPALDAFIQASTNKKWSWNLYPIAATPSKPMRLSSMKLFTDTAAAKTITANLLVSQSWAAGVVNKSSLWIEVSYIDDATNTLKTVSSKTTNGGALDTSTVTWTIEPPTYADRAFDKKKLSITTPTAIKQDTPVIVTLLGTAKSAASTDVFQFCPDVSLT